MDRFTDSIVFEQEMDAHEKRKKKTRKPPQKPAKSGTRNHFKPLDVDNISDVDDGDFNDNTTSADSSADSDSSEIEEITNEEVRDRKLDSPPISSVERLQMHWQQRLSQLQPENRMHILDW
jgi:hypothetical protein